MPPVNEQTVKAHSGALIRGQNCICLPAIVSHNDDQPLRVNLAPSISKGIPDQRNHGRSSEERPGGLAQECRSRRTRRRGGCMTQTEIAAIYGDILVLAEGAPLAARHLAAQGRAAA
jgi:hypothetical protein